MKKNVLIVGSGFAGSVIARELADTGECNVDVIEKRSNIAGNMYDFIDSNGIMIQAYGPHVLVTNRWDIIKYLMRFSDLFKHTVKELSFVDGKYVRLPFNFETIQGLVGEEKSEEIIRNFRLEYNSSNRIPIYDLLNSKNDVVRSFANLLFEKCFRNYCAKQWGLNPLDLDKSIIGRSAFVVGYDERYMNKDFQYLPVKGFTELFKNMLDSPSISVHLNEDALAKISLKDNMAYYDGRSYDAVVYTGAIDELFDCRFGELPYRSVDIRYRAYDQYKVLPEKIISYPQADGYTRKTEYKFMMHDYSEVTRSVVATEYPVPYVKNSKLPPCYPVVNELTKSLLSKYVELAGAYKNLFLCGRLAEFKYYNMDDCIVSALDKSAEIKKYLGIAGCQ